MMNTRIVDILLVDDSPDDVELALHALQRDHISGRVQVARDGAEAIDVLFNGGAPLANAPQRLKVVLLDLKLPKVDGLEVLRRLKADPRTRTVPVVMLTSSREERDIIESYQLGVNSYIVKPVQYDDFSHVVRQLGHYWGTLNQPPLP